MLSITLRPASEKDSIEFRLEDIEERAELE